jgi:nucleotide-binding universal stress UspA family protein
MQIKTILVPTDFSEHAGKAIETAEILAKPLGAVIHLLHVLHLPVQAVTPEMAVVPVGFWQDLRAHAERKLDESRKAIEKQGVRCATELVEDIPGFAVAAAAKRTNADLIVMGSRGLTGLKHALLGSVAERTVRTAPCPVLTVKHDGGAALRLRTILVPMDFSPASHRALEIAKELAKSAGPAHLILVHAYYVPIELEQFLIQQGDPVLERLSESVTKDLEKILTGLQDAGISSEYLASRGAPERLIVELAKQKHADLIVMGTHGRRGLSHLLLGSVAERVVRTAECPVMTVQEKKG